MASIRSLLAGRQPQDIQSSKESRLLYGWLLDKAGMTDFWLDASMLPFRSVFSEFFPSMDMPHNDEQTSERPDPAPSIPSRLAPSYDYADQSFSRFHQHSISESSATESNDSSPTTTVSTVDESSATEPSPGSSPESPPPTSPGILRPRTADDSQQFFELQKDPLHKKGRNLKNLAVNTSRTPGRESSSASLPLPTPSSHSLAPDSSPAFVKPQTPSKRKPSSLGLTLLTPGTSKLPPSEMRLTIPPTPALGRPGALRHFQSSPSLPLFPGHGPDNVDSNQPLRITPELNIISSPAHANLSQSGNEEERNFDIPLSQEDKPEAYPNGPVCVYEPYIDLYLEPTVQQARQYDVVMNVASEVRNPFETANEPTAEEADVRIDGGGGIQYAPKRERLPQRMVDRDLSADASPTTPKATPLEANFGTGARRFMTDPEYFHVKWEHNSDIVPDLLGMVKLIDEKVAEGKRLLIHCQCGVSRSASLVVAYVLYKDPGLSVQQAYDAVKLRSKWIGPNMNLIMQLQEFKTSLMHGGVLSSNRGMTPITPSSALSEWRGPFASSAATTGSSHSTVVQPLAVFRSPEAVPVLPSGPSSAPSGTTKPPSENGHGQRVRAVSAVKPATAYVNPSGRVLPVLPVLKIVDIDRRAPANGEARSMGVDENQGESSSATPTEAAQSAATEEFAMTPLLPSSDVDPADSFGLMSPSSTEFASSPFDRSMLLASLGMGPISKHDDLGPRRSISLRTNKRTHSKDDHSLPVESKQFLKLRPKISSPNLGEQRRLKKLQAEIEASLPMSSAAFTPSDGANEPLMSPRATEFTRNPFALTIPPTMSTSAPESPHSADSDPRSPPLKGISPITRSIMDVL